MSSDLYPEHGDEKKLLIRQADSAMYRAKKMGGNRFLMAEVKSSDDDSHLDDAAQAKQNQGPE